MTSDFSVNMNEYLPLRDVVFNTLRQAILKGELKPGERLMEIALAERLGVSRTPIREAMRKLEQEGLVVMIPRRGAQVANITEKDLNDVLEVRIALENVAIEKACDRMTEEEMSKLWLAAKEFEHTIAEGNLVKLAEENNTPFFSSSALRFSDELTTLGRENIAFINSRGPGDFDTYAIHQIEPITMLMGAEATRVMAVGAGMHQTVVIAFKGGRSAVMSHYGWSGVDFNMTVSYADGSTTVVPALSNSFPNFIKAMCDFFRTGEIKAAHEDTVAIMGIIEAGNKAIANPGVWIEV